MLDASWAAGKAMETPGTCDLMSDNYDGLFSDGVNKDIGSKNGISKLLVQRASAGSVVTNGSEYKNADYFDSFYAKGFGSIGLLNASLKDYSITLFPNTWLMALNKNFYFGTKDAAKDKYIFYTGFSVGMPIAAAVLTWNRACLPRCSNASSWNDTLEDTDIIVGFDIAASTVAGQTGYAFNDSVVPISSGILDFKRGQLLENGQIKSNYPKTGMEADLPDYVKEDDLRNNYVYRSENDWGAK